MPPIKYKPFSNHFSCTDGSQGSETFKIKTGKELIDFTVYVETDNIGPISINAYVLIEGNKHQLVQGAIYDGDGYYSKRLEWKGIKPLDRFLQSTLTIQWANYCGTDAMVRFTGVVKK